MYVLNICHRLLLWGGILFIALLGLWYVCQCTQQPHQCTCRKTIVYSVCVCVCVCVFVCVCVPDLARNQFKARVDEVAYIRADDKVSS